MTNVQEVRLTAQVMDEALHRQAAWAEASKHQLRAKVPAEQSQYRALTKITRLGWTLLVKSNPCMGCAEFVAAGNRVAFFCMKPEWMHHAL